MQVTYHIFFCYAWGLCIRHGREGLDSAHHFPIDGEAWPRVWDSLALVKWSIACTGRVTRIGFVIYHR